tara:strand:+ start:128 stop:1156 length:1029 start_codon:yes stop_codon:yes gene_type:complete
MKKFLLILLLLFIVACSCETIEKEFPVIMQFDTECDYMSLVPGEVKIEIVNDEFVIIGSDATAEEIDALEENECVIRLIKKAELPSVLAELKEELNASRDAKFEELELNRTLEKKDVLDRDDLDRELERLHPEIPGGIMSPYQLYVTPDNEVVQEWASEYDGIEEIYREALDWMWVSEETLNGVEELWLLPEEFLENTPYYASNPVPGHIASDCEDQANALVSILIADGWDVTKIRVVLGMVDFGTGVGGHAWVEVYDDGWYALEATMGDYFDDATGTYVDAGYVPSTYFKYNAYPVRDIWYYYNNEYFFDIDAGMGNAPQFWKQGSQQWLERDLESFQGRR